LQSGGILKIGFGRLKDLSSAVLKKAYALKQ
jgi:hypothetical protein